MTRQQIDILLSNLSDEDHPRLEETHISWVILSGDYVYKIKKPVRFHFLDFTSMVKRQFYCERELTLNRRLTDDIYLAVVPVKQNECGVSIGDCPGEIIDHAVCMRRMEAGRRMDRLLMTGMVSTADIDALAQKIARFHRSAEIINNKDARDISEKFADLASEEFFLQQHLPHSGLPSISHAIRVSDIFSEKHARHVYDRIHRGFVRDCHGDLHTRNIFLLTTPQPFDCIEFNDDLREIDVLNEVAFLCMDLEAFGRNDLSRQFMHTYNTAFPSLETQEDRLLLQYYKSYRANVRAKIYSLAARNAVSGDEQAAALAQADRYLGLMNGYLQKLMTCRI